MVESPYFEKFQDDSVDKQIQIEFDGGVITNEDFDGQNFELTESLCSESELRFGCCEASSIKIKVHNIFAPLKDKWITASTTLEGMGESFPIGKYKVFSDVPTADRKYREVVAYDAMYDIIGADVADWYNTILPDKGSKVTMKRFRESFVAHFGLEWVDPLLNYGSKENSVYGLANDDMMVEKTIEPSEISGKDVITAICEINACFGHIGRDGKFHFIYLPQTIQGLYPANDLYPDHAPDYLSYQQKTGHLYPQDPKSTRIGKSFYIKCQYEDFTTRDIDKIQIQQEENDIGCIYGEGTNCYIIQDNFLVYGKSAEELNSVAKNIYSKISSIIYRPISTVDTKGNLCFEVGDPIRLSTRYEIVETYILKRTLKGIQALRDNYSANGVLEYGEKVNSVAKSIIQLKGKTNVLKRNVEENRLEMADLEAGLKNEISITAAGLEAEINRAEKAEAGLQKDYTAQITTTAKELSTEITEKTQYVDTGGYNITHKGDKPPTEPVYVGEYYLDELSMKIYLGIAGIPQKNKVELEQLAYYEFNKNAYENYGNAFYDKGPGSSTDTPDRIYESDLDNYNWDENIPNRDWDAGEVFLEVTWRDVITYYIGIEKIEPAIPAHWEEVGIATIVDLPELSAKVSQTAEGLKSTVKKGNVSSEISQEAGKISITGDRISITSQNFKLTDDGKVTCTGAVVSGTIKSTGISGNTEVTNGGFYIYDNSNQVTGCFYGSTGGRLDIYASPGNTGNLAFSASASKTDIYAGGLRVHQGGLVVDNDLTVKGDMSVDGSKNRVVNTKNYGSIVQYCYETASPVFGDMGMGKTDLDGYCYIFLDPLFSETVNTLVDYCVFLQKEGKGDLWVDKKNTDYFLVRGTPNLCFSWEIKAKQLGYEYERLENPKNIKSEDFETYENT